MRRILAQALKELLKIPCYRLAMTRVFLPPFGLLLLACPAMRQPRATLAGASIRVPEAREIPWSLEDVFISVVEKAKREERLAA